MLDRSDAIWEFTAKAVTRCTVLTLPRQAFREALADCSASLREHIERRLAGAAARPEPAR